MEDVDKEENHPQILFDHVNEEALGELATREVSKVFRLSNGSGTTLLRAQGMCWCSADGTGFRAGHAPTRQSTSRSLSWWLSRRRGGGAREGRTGIS